LRRRNGSWNSSDRVKLLRHVANLFSRDALGVALDGLVEGEAVGQLFLQVLDHLAACAEVLSLLGLQGMNVISLAVDHVSGFGASQRRSLCEAIRVAQVDDLRGDCRALDEGRSECFEGDEVAQVVLDHATAIALAVDWGPTQGHPGASVNGV
jgi:hypothetical protein